ncbi:MAG TPA: CYTH and CHAD domain-containing protein [Ramlibacter sp.]
MTAPMREFELKLEIPAARLKAVQQDVARLKGSTQVLRAVYYDTPAHDLQKHGLALRVREESGEWVQTLKGDSGRALERLEYEVALGHRGAQPPLPAIEAYVGSDIARRLHKALGPSNADPMWAPLFATEVRRTTKLLREGDSQVEIAFDRGRIVAGDEEIAVREIEFELTEGAPSGAVALARRWLAKHHLWLGAISKFDKGLRLANGIDQGPPVTAHTPVFDDAASVDAVARASLTVCLDQVLRNAGELAATHPTQGHIHQLRIGIRRTRTALRHLFERHADASIEPALVHAFRVLGQRRDVEHVVQQLDPVIRAAGGPALDAFEARSPMSASAVVRAPAFQDALLQLVQLAHQEDGGGMKDVKDFLAKELGKLREQALKDGRDFERLDPERQHRVRKRLKRLRYLAEFAAPLFASRKAGAFIDELKPAQDALGLYNDEMTALAWYREQADTQPRAWFAVGWLAARRERQAEACAGVLRELAKATPFWKDD